MDVPKPGSISVGDELKAFLEGPVSILVGTRDSRLVPEITRAWGPRVSEDRRSISLCVPLATSGKTIDNLEANREIAVTFSLPINYRTYQLKGNYTAAEEPDASDLAFIERHREAFATASEHLGQPRARIEAFWRAELETSAEFVKVRFVPGRIFDQTPGPGAGKSL